jgi:hypothetical protein
LAHLSGKGPFETLADGARRGQRGGICETLTHGHLTRQWNPVDLGVRQVIDGGRLVGTNRDIMNTLSNQYWLL